MNVVDQAWQDMIADDSESRSWEDVLEEHERAGGPSEWGNSRYSDFERCEYRYWVKHVLGYRPKKRNEALEVGGLFHECRARAYQAYQKAATAEDENGNKIYLPEELDEIFTEALFELCDRAAKHVPTTVAIVRRLLQVWHKAHGPRTLIDDRHETLLVEALIDTNDGFPYSTRLDRVVMSGRLGGPCIMEIKTASRRTADLLDGYRMDPQFLGQQYCWKNSKYYKKYGALRGFIVDLCVKGQVVQVTRESVPVDVKLLRPWAKEKRYRYSQILTCEASGYWPRRRTNCVMYGKRCGLSEHCSTFPPGRREFPGWEKI